MKDWLRKVKGFFFPGGAFLGLSYSNMIKGQVKGAEMRQKMKRKGKHG